MIAEIEGLFAHPPTSLVFFLEDCRNSYKFPNQAFWGHSIKRLDSVNVSRHDTRGKDSGQGIENALGRRAKQSKSCGSTVRDDWGRGGEEPLLTAVKRASDSPSSNRGIQIQFLYLFLLIRKLYYLLI
jgi:hypothetical protein